MASIKIQNSHKNLIFAAKVAEETGATFMEGVQGIVIGDTPCLTIPRYVFDQAFDADGCMDGIELDEVWRSLILNKSGYLIHLDDNEILISNYPPTEKQPATLLRWPSMASKKRAEEWATRAGFDSLTAYVLAAVDDYCVRWARRAGEGEQDEQS